VLALIISVFELAAGERLSWGLLVAVVSVSGYNVDHLSSLRTRKLSSLFGPSGTYSLECIDGLYKTECIRTQVFHQGLYRTIGDVEYATAGWVDWYNNRRLHASIGMVPPAEHEQVYNAVLHREPQPGWIGTKPWAAWRAGSVPDNARAAITRSDGRRASTRRRRRRLPDQRLRPGRAAVGVGPHSGSAARRVDRPTQSATADVPPGACVRAEPPVRFEFGGAVHRCGPVEGGQRQLRPRRRRSTARRSRRSTTDLGAARRHPATAACSTSTTGPQMIGHAVPYA